MNDNTVNKNLGVTELKKSNKKLNVLFYYFLEDIFDNRGKLVG